MGVTAVKVRMSLMIVIVLNKITSHDCSLLNQCNSSNNGTLN